MLFRSSHRLSESSQHHSDHFILFDMEIHLSLERGEEEEEEEEEEEFGKGGGTGMEGGGRAPTYGGSSGGGGAVWVERH